MSSAGRAEPLRPDAPELDRLERWFQAAVMHPDGSEGATTDRAVAELIPAGPTGIRTLEEVLLPSAQLTARERLDIYASSYFLRLRDILKSDFPGLFHALGEEPFDRVARAYLTRHPSTSFTLNDLAAGLPGFLSAFLTGSVSGDRIRFLVGLATLERILDELFHAATVPAADVKRLQALPPERWGDARFTLIPAHRLLRFDAPVNAYLQAVYDEHSPELPAPAESFLLVYRKEWRVWRADLVREQFELLETLRSGATLSTAIERVLASPGVAADALFAKLGSWFQEWTAEGLFAAIDAA